MNIIEIFGDPNQNQKIHRSCFLETHHKIKSTDRPKASEVNTCSFTDVIQRAKNIELNKLNSVNKIQEIRKTVKTQRIITSYSKLPDVKLPVKIENSFNNCRGVAFYDNYSSNTVSTQSTNDYHFESSKEIEKIDLYI